MSRSNLTARFGLLALIGLFLASDLVFADARTNYLVSMLENGGNYRIRVQAANNLGKIRSKEAIPALTKALEDSNELVIIAVASALGQIGDASAVKSIERALQNPPSKAARSQLEATLRVLRAVSRDSKPSNKTERTLKYLIRVDAMGDSSKHGRSDTSAMLKQLVNEHASREPGVLLQTPEMSGEEVVRTIKEKRLSGYILSGSVLALDRINDQIVVKVSLNVFTNPDYNLLMMPSAQAAVSMPAGTRDETTLRATEEKALRAVVQSLLGSIFQALSDLNEGP